MIHTTKTLDLETCNCGNPHCEAKGFTLTPACHAIVCYCKRRKALRVHCCVCKELIITVAVAEEA